MDPDWSEEGSSDPFEVCMMSCLAEASLLCLCLQETPSRELGLRSSAVRSLELEEAEGQSPEETRTARKAQRGCK